MLAGVASNNCSHSIIPCLAHIRKRQLFNALLKQRSFFFKIFPETVAGRGRRKQTNGVLGRIGVGEFYGLFHAGSLEDVEACPGGPNGLQNFFSTLREEHNVWNFIFNNSFRKFGKIVAAIGAAEENGTDVLERFDGCDSGLGCGGDGVVVKSDVLKSADFLEAMWKRFEILDGRFDGFGAD